MATKNQTYSRSWGKTLALIAAFAVPMAALAVFGGYYYKQYQALDRMSADEFANRESEKILKEVGKLYSLPKDEKPTVATVKDKAVLQKQSDFFDQAANNDSVIIYQKAKLAILYRPAEKRLVKVGPLNIQETVRIKVIGSTDERQAAIKKLSDNKLTASEGGEAKTAVAGVVVVDVSGSRTEEAKRIADLLGGQVTTLPEGESKPADADILVIAGPAVQPAG